MQTIRPEIMQRALERYDTCRELGHSLHSSRIAARTAIQSRTGLALVPAEKAIQAALEARRNQPTRPGGLL